ncbi:hypothetical protein IFM89_003839 [Coptis chinensis]|uniref:plant cystathionine gamma-synthase n=1 Tax=Coptis chinensis TaxID=261450 RepID=A0A835ME32_9MAGN|nr:hypothetical protein IFM89_003839 [Coptis chinensis]
MAVASCHARVLPTFECRSDPGNSKPEPNRFSFKSKPKSKSFVVGVNLYRFPPNFVRQLSNKARRNCSNIGVAQVVAASWSNNDKMGSVAAVDSVTTDVNEVVAVGDGGDCNSNNNNSASNSVVVQSSSDSAALKASFLCADGSIAVHAGERLGRGIFTDGITTPVVNTTAYWFKNSDELIDFKEGRYASFEYGRYGNPTTESLERKISALEQAETTLFLASGMCASTVLMFALVEKGGHIVTTTDCYRKTRIFIQDYLVPNMDVSVTVIDPGDVSGLQYALDQNNVSLFFTESPTNPYLRCVDIELVSKLCHSKGAQVCIDGTFATPVNQKALSLGADIVLNSATKYIGGHNDVIGGCISGSMEVIAKIRKLHHVLGGVLNPNAAYLFIRGIKTLHLRVKQQNSTALEMAKVLEAHPKIARVHYPGLPSHPDYDIAMRQMTGFGGVVSFEVDGDLHTTKKFIDALKIAYIAPSFGGCESIVDQPAIMSYWDLTQDGRAMFGIKDNLVRFSFGVEDFEDLKADILQALATL